MSERRGFRAASRTRPVCCIPTSASLRSAPSASLGSMFLPWWRNPFPPELSYWAVNRFTFIELAIVLVAGSVLVMLYGRADGRGFHLPLSDGTLAAGAGIWACVLVLARIADPPSRGGADYGLRWGFLVALLSGARARLRRRARRAGATAAARPRRRRRTRTPPRPPCGWAEPCARWSPERPARSGTRSPSALAERGDDVRVLVRDAGQGRRRAARGRRPRGRRRHRPCVARAGRRGMRGRVQRDGPAGAVGARREHLRPRERRGHARARECCAPRRRAAAGPHEHP